MFNKFYANDEISALVYQAVKLEKAGYNAQAAAIRRQPLSFDKFSRMLSTFFTFIASLFNHDDFAALAYEARQMAAAGYTNDFEPADRQPGFAEKIVRSASASLSSVAYTLFTRDDPAALAYEASQMTAAGYLPETIETCRQPGIVEQTEANVVNFFYKSQPAHNQTSLCPTHAQQNC